MQYLQLLLSLNEPPSRFNVINLQVIVIKYTKNEKPPTIIKENIAGKAGL